MSYIIDFLCAVAVLMVAAYLWGEFNGSRVYMPAGRPTVDVTPEPFRVHETITGPIDVTLEMVPVTATIDLIPTDLVSNAQLTAQLAAANENLKLERRLHKVWLRNTRIARARYNAVVGVTFAASRRPTLERALAIVTPIGTVRKPETVHVITPQWRQQLIEGAAA